MALLMIRTWEEEGSEPAFRAQIRIATERSSGFASTQNTADPEQVIVMVRAFLEGSVTRSTDDR